MSSALRNSTAHVDLVIRNPANTNKFSVVGNAIWRGILFSIKPCDKAFGGPDFQLVQISSTL